jgi:hypothetical protein
MFFQDGGALNAARDITSVSFFYSASNDGSVAVFDVDQRLLANVVLPRSATPLFGCGAISTRTSSRAGPG